MVFFAAKAKAEEREHKGRAWTAWHTAWLTAYAPSKPREFTKLSALTGDAPSARRQPYQLQISAAKAWHLHVTALAK